MMKVSPSGLSYAYKTFAIGKSGIVPREALNPPAVTNLSTTNSST
jgi:hypothetical protein